MQGVEVQLGSSILLTQGDYRLLLIALDLFGLSYPGLGLDQGQG